MRFLLLLPFLLCTSALAAQNSNVRVTEIDMDGRYSFRVRAGEAEVPMLVDAFVLVGESGINSAFRGSKEFTAADGIILILDTDRKDMSIAYRGDDQKALARAREKAKQVRQRLEQPTPPTPPNRN